MKNKIESYIITGFLGAGKTTILNSLLRQTNNNKNIVIENEFGKINIDATLISGLVEGLFELTNGCICCSINNQLLETLQKIDELKDRPSNLFIETTGIADAGEVGAVFSSFFVDKAFSLNKVICVVDADNFESYVDSNIEIQKQIVAADIVVLNKLNSIDTFKIENLNSIIKTINSFATIAESYNGDLDINVLKGSVKTKEILEIPLSKIEVKHKIKTLLFETESRFNIQQLKYELFKSLFLFYHQIYRMKGYVLDENGQVHLVQTVGKNSTIEPVNDISVEKSQLVVIGKEIELNAIERILKPAIQKEIKIII
ncbi:CobW family GTP-binding protein [Flavobacterium sp.]|jgi:G3E family GTPase|uniref:CobW family GTP-binding protein n=2 Tax=Flavobacterium sp. TaxID=239 RepID=UPI0037BEE123